MLPREGAVEALKLFRPRRHRPCDLHRLLSGKGHCEENLCLLQQKRTVLILARSVSLDLHNLPQHRSRRSRAPHRKALRFS